MLYDVRDDRRKRRVIKSFPDGNERRISESTQKSLGGVKAKKIVAEPSHQRFYASENPFLGDDGWLEHIWRQLK